MQLVDPQVEFLRSELARVKHECDGLALDLEQSRNACKTLRELKETLASHLQMRVDADIALEKKWGRILALAADWRKE